MGKIYKNSQPHICPYCNGEFFGRRGFKKHKSDCAKEHGFGIDSIGRFINPDCRKLAMENFRKRVEAGEANWSFTGKHHTAESIQKMSISHIRFLETHHNHGLKWYTVNGHKVQGTWEKRFAEYLTDRNIKWKRTRLKYEDSHFYTPDFYCPEEDVYFEVKGFRRDRDLYKMHMALKCNPGIRIKLIEKYEINHLEDIDIFSLPNFEDKYPLSNVDTTKFEKY